jgi:predicted phosphodiesterase
MKLALISDIHANLKALDATLADIALQSVDRIVCLGDIVGYNQDAAECIARIRDSDCLCVAGNHDLAVCGRITTEKFSADAERAVAWTREQLTQDDLDFLCNLPVKATIGGGLIAVHGALHPEENCESVRLDNDDQRLLSFIALMGHSSGARICAFGHTHRAVVYEWRHDRVVVRSEKDVQLEDGAYYLINPGTVGEPRAFDRRATYMLLDLAKRTATIRYVEYDASSTTAAGHKPGRAPRFGLAALSRKLHS